MALQLRYKDLTGSTPERRESGAAGKGEVTP